jgi:L-threonylcarbamoyladenylate synthase
MRAEIEEINPKRPSKQVLRRAARLIRKGAVMVCPTDTGYALAANALDTKAIVKVFNIKGRDYANPIHMAVSSLEMAERYAHISPEAEQLAHNFLPGALTLVLPRREVVPSLLVGGRDTVGIRIPDNRVIMDLAVMADLPITATSANISGQTTPYSVPEVLRLLGEAAEQVTLILDQGLIPSRGLSTIVDLTVSPPQLLRQGLVSWLEVRQVLQSLHDFDAEQH